MQKKTRYSLLLIGVYEMKKNELNNKKIAKKNILKINENT